MRYRVDTAYGYASFDEYEYEKAFDLYRREGLRLLKGDRLGEETILVAEKKVSA